MGANDRNPTGSATLRPWKHAGLQALISWEQVPAEHIVDLVTQASRIGAYVGFGGNSDRTALLIYVKNGNLNQRVGVESVLEAEQAIAFILAEWLERAF